MYSRLQKKIKLILPKMHKLTYKIIKNKIGTCSLPIWNKLWHWHSICNWYIDNSVLIGICSLSKIRVIIISTKLLCTDLQCHYYVSNHHFLLKPYSRHKPLISQIHSVQQCYYNHISDVKVFLIFLPTLLSTLRITNRN